MRAWLIDEDGEAWTEGAVELDTYLRIAEHSETVTAYLVKHAGFVRISGTCRSASVMFAAEAVSALALVGTMRWLTEHAVEAVVFEHCGDPLPKLAANKGRWLAHLSACIEARQAPGRFVSRCIPLAMSPFNTRIAAAREILQAVGTPSTRDRLLGSLLDDRFVLSRLEGDDAAPIFVALGNTFTKVDPDFVPLATGRRLTDGPDVEYSRWVAAHYRSVWLAGEPVADDVDAMIGWTGRKARPSRHSRVVIPARCGSDRLLLSATVARSP